MADACTELGMAAYYLGIHNYVQAAIELDDAKDEFYDMRGYMYSIGYTLHTALDYIEDSFSGLGAVDMASILDAMWEANAIEFHHFVGYIDAYRANMWNLPFYTEWHTLLVRHFSQ